MNSSVSQPEEYELVVLGGKAGTVLEPENELKLLESHADYLFNFAVREVRNAVVAEDLVQETFLAALKGRSAFAGRSSQRTWLVGILRHKICDHFRRHQREQAVRILPVHSNEELLQCGESAILLHEVASDCHSPSRGLELIELGENLRNALSKLPPRLAKVFQLYAVEGRSNADVCGQLGISEGNLWVMLYRGRQQLRRHLDQWWEGRR